MLLMLIYLKHAAMMQWIVDSGLMVQMISGREKIDEIWSLYQSPLYHHWQYFDCDPVHVTQWKQMNDVVGDGRGIKHAENNDTPHFNWISDKKIVLQWVPTCYLPCKNNVVENYVRNIWLITKRKELSFCNE